MSDARTRPGGDETDDGAEDTVAACEAVVHEYQRGSSGWFGLGRRESPRVRALDGVSLSVRRGEFLAVVGPSGSGKSTLLHLLAALLVPTGGEVRVLGEETAALAERGRARLRLRGVGVVFQRFHLLPSLSARANVALPLVERGVGRRARRERATDLLERFGLGDRTGHRPGELSGGEQQRVAIARALANDPALVVADEPTGELDTATGSEVLSAFRDLADEGRAVVMASHDPSVREVADRVVGLRDGRRVEAEGPALVEGDPPAGAGSGATGDDG